MREFAEIILRQQFILEQGCHMRDSLIMVLEGSFSCTIESQTYQADKGDICVFPKGVPFDRKVLVPIRCVYLQFEKFPIDLPAGKLTLPDPNRAESTVRYLAKAVEDKLEAYIDHYLQDLFFLYFPAPKREEEGEPAVKDCKEYIGRHFAQALSLEELAKLVALSKQSLIRKFKDSTGMTPMQYLGAVRINESKLLLRDTDMTVSQVAQESGFENVYYFSNSFRKATGITPTQYRKRSGL